MNRLRRFLKALWVVLSFRPGYSQPLPLPSEPRRLIFNEPRPVAEFDVDLYMDYLEDKHHGDGPDEPHDEDCF
jgi:hypothetical protein